MLAHDGLDGLGGLVGVVEGDAADVVVQDVRLDDAVQQLAADEAHLAVNGGGSAADEVPLLAGVVRQGRIGVLQEGDGDWIMVSGGDSLFSLSRKGDLPSQWLTQR